MPYFTEAGNVTAASGAMLLGLTANRRTRVNRVSIQQYSATSAEIGVGVVGGATYTNFTGSDNDGNSGFASAGQAIYFPSNTPAEPTIWLRTGQLSLIGDRFDWGFEAEELIIGGPSGGAATAALVIWNISSAASLSVYYEIVGRY